MLFHWFFVLLELNSELNPSYLTHCCYQLMIMILLILFTYIMFIMLSVEKQLYQVSYCFNSSSTAPLLLVTFTHVPTHLYSLDFLQLYYYHHYVINFICYVTCWVPSITSSAFFDGIHISICLHDCTFIYSYFSNVLSGVWVTRNKKSLKMARKVWNFEISYTFVYTKVQKKSEIKKKKIWIQILIWILTGLIMWDENRK